MANLKFKLTHETKVNPLGFTLFRIEATADFTSSNGYKVDKGQKGGWVDTEMLQDGNARVSGNAWVSDDAQVFGNARVSGNAWVSDDAQVFGNARVSGNAWVSDDAQVFGNAWVSDDAQVFGNARVSGNAWVSDDAQVFGNARLSAAKRFIKGWFCAADDDDTPKKLTVLHGEVDSDPESPYWVNTYVLGDCEIENIEQSDNKPDESASVEIANDGLVNITVGSNGFSLPKETAETLVNALNSALGK